MLVDVENPDTWPSGTMEIAAGYVSKIQGSDTPLEDLAREAGRLDTEIAALLEGHRLRAYHCTRLLDYEVAGIWSDGLQPFSDELRGDKLAAAQANGYLTAEEYETLRNSRSVGESFGQKVRSRIHLFVSTLELESHLCEITSYLTYWGGEALYDGTAGLRDSLGRLGRPAIVCAGLDVKQIHSIDESLAVPFVATLAQWPSADRGAVISYGAAIPGEHIEAIWQPGDSGYDRFPGLPR